MRNKKGFTLVELVIVIAVIAILAGVMIGTFASVVKKEKDSAKAQEMAAAKQEQVANDVIEKLNNGSWLGWTDFEEKLAKALADVNPNTPALTEASVKAAVAAALNEYAAAHPNTDKPNTGLTEQQVKYIIENALSGQLTAEQVKAIVNSAVSSTSTLTKSQVQAIVDAAVGKTITASQVKDVVNEVIKANKVSTLTVAEVEEKINSILNSKSYSTLTDKEVEKIVKALLKDYSVSAKEVGTDKTLQEALNEVDANSTVAVKLTNDITEGSVVINKNTVIDLNGHNFTVPFRQGIKVEAGKTLTIKGDSGKIIGDGTAINVYGNGQLVIDGGDFINTKEQAGEGVCLICNDSNGLLTINGGTFNIAEGAYYTVYAKKDSTTVINGGTFNSIGVAANASKDGTGTDNAVCIINGGTFNQNYYDDCPAIFWPAGTLSIYGGTFTSKSTALAVCGGTVNLYGGTFTSTGTGTDIGTSGPFVNGGNTICVITGRASKGNGYVFESMFIGKDVVATPVAGANAVVVYSGGLEAYEWGTATKTYATITADITITK